jgi:hypothetical protein
VRAVVSPPVLVRFKPFRVTFDYTREKAAASIRLLSSKNMLVGWIDINRKWL